MLFTPLFVFLKIDLSEEIFLSVGDSDKISKSFVIKKNRVKQKKKKVADSDEDTTPEKSVESESSTKSTTKSASVHFTESGEHSSTEKSIFEYFNKDLWLPKALMK